MPNAQSEAVRRSEDNLCPTKGTALCRRPPTETLVRSVDDGTRPGIIDVLRPTLMAGILLLEAHSHTPSRPRPGQVTAPSAPLMQVGSYFDT